jgi:glycosyltransferase involved in cell wall biosynthesis
LRSVQHLVKTRNRSDFHVVIMGGGTELNALRDYAAELGIEEYVTFTGRVPEADLLEGLSTADVCICPDPKTPLNDVSTMEKTMEYMALAKPIVSFDLVEARFSAGEAALYVEKDDVAAFGDAINTLLSSEELRRRMGKTGRERVLNHLSWQYSVEHLLTAYRKVFES